MNSERKEIDAGKVPPSSKKYVVTHTHSHQTLKTGDVVVMVCTPNQGSNWLFRVTDMTMHDLVDEHDQYVHLAEQESEKSRQCEFGICADNRCPAKATWKSIGTERSYVWCDQHGPYDVPRLPIQE